MKALACDPEREYFFCSATAEEVNQILFPFMESVQKKADGLRHPGLFVSSVDTLNDELAKQAKIKANPYTSSTLDFHIFLGEVPNGDLYFVVNKALNELYFVPFDTISPRRWGGHTSLWRELDKFEFKKMLNITAKPFTYRNGKQHEWWNKEEGQDREATIAILKDKIAKVKKCGPGAVYQLVFSYYQPLTIDFDSFCGLLREGGCYLDPEFFQRDQMHLRMSESPFEEKEIPSLEPRTLEEEEAYLDEKEKGGMIEPRCFYQTIYDYLDGIITWETFRGIFDTTESFGPEFDSYDDAYRRKAVWEMVDKGPDW